MLRAGFGLFYDRFSEGLTLEAIRLNGIRQQRYIVPFPSFYSNVPPPESLATHLAPSAIREVDRGLRAPYMAQTAVKLERQLSKNVSLSLTYINTRGVHMLRSRNINAPLPGTYNPKQPDSGLRPYGGTQNIYLYESSGIFKQNQFITRINANVSSKLILFGFYVLNEARSNTDGAGSFPANSYNLATEYGRAGFDVRHRAFLGGSIMGPLGLRFSPFMVVTSGHPYTLTLGRDLNGDSLYSDRPAFATDLTRPGVVVTPYGAFDTRPAPGETIIPRNYGNGPGLFFLNLRLSRTFGFGGEPIVCPLSGSLAGIIKTASHEWPEIQAKALDIAADFDTLEAPAEQIVDEFLTAGPVEVGITPVGRSMLELTSTPLDSHSEKPPWGRDGVVVVTGGARGVTAEVAVAIGRATGCKLLLAGRSGEPTEEPDWLAPLTEEADIKRAIIGHHEGGATPKAIEAEFRRCLANREIRSTLDRIEAAGAKAIYRSIDVRDEIGRAHV